MSTLAHLATNNFIITRVTETSGYLEIFATVTGARGNLQPLSPAKVNLFNGVMGKTFQIYMDGGIDVDEGDRFRDVNTNKIYQIVNGGITRRTQGIIDFNEIVVELIS